jgi:hypothetical protein
MFFILHINFDITNFVTVNRNGTSVCLLQTENGNGELFFFCKWKRTFVFLAWQTINCNRHLLFQQKCPSVPLMDVSSSVSNLDPDPHLVFSLDPDPHPFYAEHW